MNKAALTLAVAIAAVVSSWQPWRGRCGYRCPPIETVKGHDDGRAKELWQQARLVMVSPEEDKADRDAGGVCVVIRQPWEDDLRLLRG